MFTPAVSLTSCKADFMGDGAAVLKHSVDLSSYPTNKNSKYLSKMILFVHKDAVECSEPFKKLGYEIQVKDTPINVSEIKGDFLREHVANTGVLFSQVMVNFESIVVLYFELNSIRNLIISISGCCGEKEYLKLYSYTLMEYPIVVHLDLDSLILQPFDDLFDAMLDGKIDALPVMHNKSIPEDIRAFYTKDYNMIHPKHKVSGSIHWNSEPEYLFVAHHLLFASDLTTSHQY